MSVKQHVGIPPSRQWIGEGVLWLSPIFAIAVAIAWFVLSNQCAKVGTGINIAGVQVVNCAPSQMLAKKVAPAKVENIPGTNLKRVILIPEAAKRLDIQTVTVREEPILRARKVGGEVIAMPTNATSNATAIRGDNRMLVRVALNESDLRLVDRSKPARILPLATREGATGWTARSVDLSTANQDEEVLDALYFALDTKDHTLSPGVRVYVQVALVDSTMPRKIIPYSALLYDRGGDTWVYTNPEPLVYVRQRVSVNYIDGDRVILFAGPAVGTKIVTNGVAELFGTEIGVGK